MTKAYHFVFGGGEALNALLHADFIFPAIERMPQEAVMHRCEAVLGEEWVGPNVQAVVDLMEKRLEELWAMHAKEAPPFEESLFRCPDFLAGDLDHVFFSIGDWTKENLGKEPNGLVFDAEDLIRRGAAIRERDLLSEYEDAINAFLYEDSRRKSPEALEKNLRRIIENGQITEKKAIAFLKRHGSGMWQSEIVYEGRVPVDWSTEIWREGERVG